MTARHTERSTLAACVATVLGVPAADVPLEAVEQAAWLAGRGLGLVPVADAASFSWAGPWIAWRPPVGAPGERRAVVMFGVPSGPIWDPAQTTDAVVGGMVLAPLDVALWAPPAVGEAGVGVVEAIGLADDATAPVRFVASAVAVAGRGLQGDRYAAARGTFAAGRPGAALTLIDAAVLDELAAARGAPVDHRRNLVVRGIDLDALVGVEFSVGAVRCRGSRRCEPCVHLDRLNDGGVLRPLVHRGGLRADILTDGAIAVGDPVTTSGV